MQKPFCDLDLLSINPRFLLSSRPHKKVAAWIFIQPTISSRLAGPVNWNSHSANLSLKDWIS